MRTPLPPTLTREPLILCQRSDDTRPHRRPPGKCSTVTRREPPGTGRPQAGWPRRHGCRRGRSARRGRCHRRRRGQPPGRSCRTWRSCHAAWSRPSRWRGPLSPRRSGPSPAGSRIRRRSCTSPTRAASTGGRCFFVNLPVTISFPGVCAPRAASVETAVVPAAPGELRADQPARSRRTVRRRRCAPLVAWHAREHDALAPRGCSLLHPRACRSGTRRPSSASASCRSRRTSAAPRK
jgi:hypothetical protein